MKNKFSLFISIFLILCLTIGLSSCKKTNKIKVDFMVDGEKYHTAAINDKGSVSLPDAPVKQGFTFDGWYLDENVWAQPFTADSLTNSSADGDLIVFAKWYRTPIESYYIDGEYIYFGEYPQTLKANDVSITPCTDSRGYYLGSDGYYYAKLTAKPNQSDYLFSTGEGIVKDTEYYFKVEPIRWRILSENDGKAMLICDSIIDVKCFDKKHSDYSASEIRSFLTYQFYRGAFTVFQRSLITATNVDNSVESTGYTNNGYCPDTKDTVFMLSYKEAKEVLGLKNYYTGKGLFGTSDYSRASGANITTDEEHYGFGDWWLRSRCDKGDGWISYIPKNGTLTYYTYVYNTSVGVVPVLNIKLSK